MEPTEFVVQDRKLKEIDQAKERVLSQEDKLKALAGKNLIVLYSGMGSGKSVFGSKIVKRDCIVECEKTEALLAEDGHFPVATGALGDKNIHFFEMDDGTFLVEVPAPHDSSNVATSLSNQTLANQLISKAAKVSIVTLITASDFESERGRNILKLFTCIMRLLQGPYVDVTETAKQCLVPIFFHFGPKYTDKKLIKELKKSLKWLQDRAKQLDNNTLDEDNKDFDGPEFPNPKEITATLEVGKVIMENIRAMEPLNNSHGKFKDLGQSFEDAFTKSLQSAVTAAPEASSKFTSDLNHYLVDYLQQGVFNDLTKVEVCPQFRSDVRARDHLTESMSTILNGWQGKAKDTTLAGFEAKVDVCDLGDKNRVFRWFVDKVGKHLTDQAKREGNDGVTEYTPATKPISYLLLTFFLKKGIDLTDPYGLDQFSFEKWQEVIEFFKTNMSSLSDELVRGGQAYIEPCPPSSVEEQKAGEAASQEKITFDEAIKELDAAGLEDSTDEGLKKKWRNGMYGLFNECYKKAMPESFAVKESEKAALQRLKVDGGDLMDSVAYKIENAADVIEDKNWLLNGWFD